MINVGFVAGPRGTWRIDRIDAIRGATLAAAPRLARVEGAGFPDADGATWCLRGVRSNDRYATREEKAALAATSPSLDRDDATSAVLIPITKSATWWALAQDERRAIFEERSRHIAIGSDYVPAVARRLYHGRDLGEPWDFLTWFEFAPSAADEFDHMVRRLRATEEWRYVEREVEIRLSRA